MSKKVSGIELEGLEPLLKAFKGLPDEFSGNVIRTIARKPGNKVVSLARKLFPYKHTGVTKRTFGILKVKDLKQRFIEVGVKGRSLAWIFMAGAYDRQKKSTGAETGDIKPIGNVILKAGETLSASIKKEMEIDLNKVLVKGLKRYLK